MKSNKGYIASCLTLQMVVIPVLLTAGAFIVPAIAGPFLSISKSSVLGRDSVKFIYVLIAFFTSLIVGGTIGFIFSKTSKNKPDSAKIRYTAPIIPIVYALVFATLALMFSKNNYNSVWWGIYVFKNPMLFIFGFLLFFSGYHFVVPIAEIMGYSGFLLGILLHEQVSKTKIINTSTMSLKIVLSTTIAVAVLFVGISTRDIINNGIVELLYGKSTVASELTEFDLIKIAPFKENNGLAKLDKEASLKFKSFEEMPRLDGATAAYPVYAAFVEAVYEGLGDYYESNKNNHEKDIFSAFVSSNDYPLNIVRCSKTSDAYESLINGGTDIIFAAEPSKSHTEAIRAKGDEFVLTPIGYEAFVFFTNAKNSVENLTIKQIQDIYSGKIKNWKEAGGPNTSILPYQRPDNSGSQTIMQNKVMKDIKMLPPTKETYAGGMGEIINRVSGYRNAKNAIGYSFLYYSSSMIKNNQIKYISVNGIKPAPETIRNKTYPFTVPVYAVTLKSNSHKNTKKFIDWILSKEGQSLIEKTGYIPAK